MNTPVTNFRDQRRERIIQVAREVFYEVGYAGASMSMISARLGGSKATLYAYFNSKEELFEAIIRESCEAMSAILHAHIGTNDLRQSLTTVAREMLGMILSDWGNRTLQLVIEESHRNPGLARVFNETIERYGKSTMFVLLQTAHEKGQITAPDPHEAATILKSLLFGDLQFKRMLNICPAPDEAALVKHVDRAVDVFMTYYECKAL
jgi:AcrR family transcriptional regulator